MHRDRTPFPKQAKENVEKVLLESIEDPALKLSGIALVDLITLWITEAETNFVSEHPEIASFYVFLTIAVGYHEWMAPQAMATLERFKTLIPENFSYYHEKIKQRLEGKNHPKSFHSEE